MQGPGWTLSVGVVGTSEQANWDLADAVEDQLFEATAQGKYLDRLGSRAGVERPVGVGMTDDDFRNLLSAVNASQLTPDALLSVLEVFYGLDYTHAQVQSAQPAPFTIVDQSTLTFQFDNDQIVNCTFSAADYPAAATAAEVSATLNRAFIQAQQEALALPWTDQLTGNTYVRVYTGTPGLGGTVEVLGGTAQSTFLFLSSLAQVTTSTWNVIRNGSRARFSWNGGGSSFADTVRVGDVVEVGSGFNASNQGEFTLEQVFKTASRQLQPNPGFEVSTITPGVWGDGWTYCNNNQSGEGIVGSIVGSAHSGSSCQRVAWSTPVGLYADSFETIPWSTQQVTGVTGAWSAATSSINPTLSTGYDGTTFYSFNSHTATMGNQTRLYTGVGFLIPVGVASASLTFWMYHDTGTYIVVDDSLQAQVSTNGGVSWTSVGPFTTRHAGVNGWQQVTVDLTSYIGQTVNLGFLGTAGNGGNNIYLDGVAVTTISNSTGAKGIQSLGGDLGGIQGGWRAGHTYQVSFWVKATTAATQGKTMTFNWHQAPASVTWTLNPATTSSWQQYSATVVWALGQPIETVIPGGLAISIVGTGFVGSLDFDDVSVTDVTTPWFEVENNNAVVESGISSSLVQFWRPKTNLLQDLPFSAHVQQTELSLIDAVLPATAGAVTRQPGGAAYLRSQTPLVVTAATLSGDRNVLKVTTASAHGLSQGSQVIIDGLFPAAQATNGAGGSGGGVNGAFSVTGITSAYIFTVKPADGAIANQVPAIASGYAGITLTSNAVKAPDGTMTATEMSYSGIGTLGAGRASWSSTAGQSPWGPVQGVSYTAGVWLRADVPVTLQIGTDLTVSPSNVSVTTQWQYFSITTVPQPGATQLELDLLNASGDNSPFVIYYWGAILAANTSFVTTSATATPATAPAGGTIDSIIYDPQAGLLVTESVSTTTAKLDPRQGYKFLAVTDSTQFPDAPGWLCLGLGYSYQAGPVRYFGRAGSAQLLLDPGYQFPATIPAGATVNLLTGPTPGQPSHPEAGAFYLCSSPAGRIAAQGIVASMAAAGVGVHVNIQYPGDRGLAGEGLPTTGQQQLNGLVDAFAGDTVDAEVAAARVGI